MALVNDCLTSDAACYPSWLRTTNPLVQPSSLLVVGTSACNNPAVICYKQKYFVKRIRTKQRTEMLKVSLLCEQKGQDHVRPESEEEEESQHRPGPGKQGSCG